MNFEYAIKVLRRAFEEQDQEFGFANANVELLSRPEAMECGYGDLLKQEQLRMERVKAKRSDLDLAIETLLNVQAGIPIVSIDMDELAPVVSDNWRNTEKFRKENEGP